MASFKCIRDGFKRWRQQLEDMQYQDGHEWALKVYQDGQLTLNQIMDGDMDKRR